MKRKLQSRYLTDRDEILAATIRCACAGTPGPGSRGLSLAGHVLDLASARLVEMFGPDSEPAILLKIASLEISQARSIVEAWPLLDGRGEL